MTETSIVTPTWGQLLEGELSPDEAALLVQRAVAVTEDFLGSSPDAEEQAFELIARRLAAPPGAETYQVVFDSLEALAGNDLANLFHWYVSRDPDDRTLVDSATTPRVLGFLHRVVAEHGPELRSAITTWRELPDDWRVCDREVFYDVINERYRIRHRLEKMNGESITIEGNADSILGLTRAFVVSLRWLKSSDAFSPQAIEVYLPEFEGLCEMLRAGGQPSNGQGTIEVSG